MELKTPGIADLGGGLELHPIRIEDADELYAAIERNRVYLRQWLPWVSDSYSVRDAIAFATEKTRENEAGDALTMVIRVDGALCGAIGLHRIDRVNRSSSIGYWIDAECAGRGIVTRACRAVAILGFEYYRLHRIEIRCAAGNVKSAAIARRLGFHEEGTLRQAERLSDGWVDLLVFSALEHEPLKKFHSTGTPR